MNRILRLLLLSISLACGLETNLLAQRTIGLVAKAQSDKILLRWTPDSSVLWQRANQDGYYVLRRTISRNGVAVTGSAAVVLNPGGTAIKPYLNSDPFWSAAGADSAYRRSMRELLYAANPVQPPTDTVDSVKPSADDLPFYRYVMALVNADQSFTTAVAAGLGFVDATALSNERYTYEITTAIPTNVMTTTSQLATTGLADYRPLLPVDKPAARFGIQQATLSWKADTIPTGYNTYWIERSTNGTIFTTRNRQPFLVAGQDVNAFSYQDSLPKGRRTYYYRLMGKTIFDEVGYSPVVFGQSKDTLVGVPAIKTLRIQPNGSASLTWQFPGDTLIARADTLLKSFFIAVSTRSQDRPIPTQIGITPTATSATVSNYRAKAPGGTTYYFSVGAVRLDGDTLLSSPVFVEPLDTIPPTVPIGLQGIITAQGLSRLSWRPNPETDLLGYKVFRSQRTGEESSAITGDSILISSNWQDPVVLDFLNAGVYYQIRALDRHYNESALSAPLYLAKPDTLPPTPPLFQRFYVQAGGVRLRWANSSSLDVVGHTLYRRDATGGIWQALQAFAKRDTLVGGKTTAFSDTAWIDTGAQASRSYLYLLLAQDAGGLFSDSTATLLVDVPASLGSQKPYFSTLNAQSNPARQAVTLSWTYDAPDVAEYQIYRAVGRKALGLWKMVSGLENTIDDNEVKADTTYRYQLRASFKDGTLSNWQSTTIIYRITAAANESPYVVLPIPAQRATVGASFTYQVPANTFADSDGGVTIRVLPNGLPAGLSASGSILSGVPRQRGNYTITVQASDRQGVAFSTTFLLSVNAAPTLLTGLPTQTVTVGQSFTYTVPASAFFDATSTAVQVAISSAGLPTGLTANGPTLSGVLSAPGPFTIAVQATDADGASLTSTFKLLGNQPPRLAVAVTNQNALVGQPTAWTLPANTFIDPEGKPLSIVLLADGLPAGLAALGSGYVGTPTVIGTYTLTIRATDAFGTSVDVRFTLVVGQAANIPPIVASTLTAQTLTVGQPVDYSVPNNLFFDEDGQLLSITFSGNLPPGLAMQGARLTGIPTGAGTFTLTVTATDAGNLSVSTPFVLTLEQTGAFMITGVTMVSCQTITATQRSISVNPQYTGLTGQPVSFSVDALMLPTTNPGPYTLDIFTDSPTITLRATQNGINSSLTYNWLAVCRPNQAPTLVGGIAIQNATVGQAFSFVIPAATFTDDAGVSNLNLSVSGLPTGLSFNPANQTISGIANTPGSYTVTVTATDAGGLSTNTNFLLTVSTCFSGDPHIVTGTFSSSTPVAIGAVNRIETDTAQPVTINPNASLILKAGQSVRLKPGFVIKPGASFRAYNGPCN